MKVYKLSLPLSVPGKAEVPGTPISVGLDGDGHPVVWFLTDGRPAEVVGVWTGSEVHPGALLFLGTVVERDGMVWHFWWGR